MCNVSVCVTQWWNNLASQIQYTLPSSLLHFKRTVSEAKLSVSIVSAMVLSGSRTRIAYTLEQYDRSFGFWRAAGVAVSEPSEPMITVIPGN